MPSASKSRATRGSPLTDRGPATSARAQESEHRTASYSVHTHHQTLSFTRATHLRVDTRMHRARSHLPLAAQRQLELELAALRRAVARAFTSLDVGRRKWAAQSESGKRSLSACVNGLTQLAYAEGTHWGALSECTEMRRLVAVRALHKLRAAQAEVADTLEVRTTLAVRLRLRLSLKPCSERRTLGRHSPRRSAA